MPRRWPTSSTRHDEQIGEGGGGGTAGRYAAALTALDASDASIAQMRALRDRLGRTSDVAVLTGWIDRNAAYDAALRRLYRALVAVEGPRHRPGPQARFDGEREARAQLPKDTSARGRDHVRHRPGRARTRP